MNKIQNSAQQERENRKRPIRDAHAASHRHKKGGLRSRPSTRACDTDHSRLLLLLAALHPLLLMLLAAKALVVVSLELEELLKVRLAVVHAPDSRVVAEGQRLLALVALEARLMEHLLVRADALHRVHSLLAHHALVARAAGSASSATADKHRHGAGAGGLCARLGTLGRRGRRRRGGRRGSLRGLVLVLVLVRVLVVVDLVGVRVLFGVRGRLEVGDLVVLLAKLPLEVVNLPLQVLDGVVGLVELLLQAVVVVLLRVALRLGREGSGLGRRSNRCNGLVGGRGGSRVLVITSVRTLANRRATTGAKSSALLVRQVLIILLVRHSFSASPCPA
eukprot:Opistho-1_new@58055